MNAIIEQIAACKRTSEAPYSAYLYDMEALRRHAASSIAALPPYCRLYYAVKANPEEPILRALSESVHGFEVASFGEMEKVRRAAPAAPVIFGGPGKTDAEIEGALQLGVQLFHVESRNELQRIGHIASRLGIVAPVLLRVNLRASLPDATLTMAGPRSQFGIDEHEIPDVISLAGTLPSIKLEGFHLHSLSNNLSSERHIQLVKLYCSRVMEWIRMFNLDISYLNAGGGIGVNYAELDDQFDWRAFTEGLAGEVSEVCPPGVTVIFECGRYLSAFCGYYAAEVLDVKHNHGHGFVVIRGGTHHFRLPSSWQHNHPFRILPIERWDYPFARAELTDAEITIAGELCTPKDVLARDIYVEKVRIGDIVLFELAGAYGWTISHHDFLSHPHPQHLFIHEQGSHLQVSAR
ncbi:type III PLP-dependent enzyme [Paenibacillus oenotherae]|uniref:Type III PLP-dependent enzyme n=2 Tax=Paenibacillus oenotherae TaxID=1435645 RepID=A0ABS7D0H9_9BACL|nr:type III PLP-dependent enzyme [Paenibacillus oenotherae]